MTLTIQYQPVQITEGTIVSLSAEPPNTSKRYIYKWEIEGGALTEPPDRQTGRSVHWDTTGLVPGAYSVKVTAELDPAIKPTTSAPATDTGEELIAIAVRPLSRDDVLPVALRRTTTQPTRDQALWVAIRNRTKAIAFSGSGYKDFIDSVLCDQTTPPGDARLRREMAELGSQVRGVGAYELLKTATEVFLLLNCGVEIKDDAHVRFDSGEEATRLGERVPLHVLRRRLENYLGDPRRLPYIKRVLDAAFPGKEENDSVFCDDVVIASRVDGPCMLELIWSYWHEEGMLVQAMNAISLRFQNRRNGSDRDPLAHLEIAPVRPLNNLLWGYVQDEQNRLTVQRRAYEYDHHYGLKLVGKVVPQLRSADSRSKFLEGYHNLLHLATLFYLEDDDTTRLADAFPLLNALKETHLTLAQGAHNQFGDLPWTARIEMLIQQWLLSRPEMRDFLQSRPMVPYQEAWMGQVDTLKQLEGWTDVSVSHFRDLGVFGEQSLLSIRYGDWIGVNDPAQAANWARYWRPEIQSYIHSYRVVTGVELTADAVNPQDMALRYTQPSVLLSQRSPNGSSGSALPASATRATQRAAVRR